MNYPLISEYIESIKLAEDNFEELSYLRPVLDADGQPVMSSGNFAVVFKMKDERDGKLYAVRCFHRDQEGRAESYRLIEDELKDVESPYLVSFRYMDKELFVDSIQTDETEFPVLLMDWVEGITLDKYLRENLDDQYALEMLAYRFSQLDQWLIPQPFAHGDLKPDNILVREDGTLVLVDYDGMYVPAMKGQKARELGSPDFRHPLRTEDDFDEHIDDFPLVSILLSLKAISISPLLLEEYGESHRLLLSENDYRDISHAPIMPTLLYLLSIKDFALTYSIFMSLITHFRASQGAKSTLKDLCSERKFSNMFGHTRVDENNNDAWIEDEKGVRYSKDGKKLIRGGRMFEPYEIHAGTEIICDRAFSGSYYSDGSGWNHLEQITIPQSVKYIGQNPFAFCGVKVICNSWNFRLVDDALYSADRRHLIGYYGYKRDFFVIPEGVETIGNYAFAGRGLKYVKLSSTIKIIGDYAFEGCPLLEKIKMSDSIKTIGQCAFSNCERLQEIELPDGLISIGSFAFSWCMSLRSITIPSTVLNLGVNPFLYDRFLTIHNNAYLFELENKTIYTQGKRFVICCLSQDLSFQIPHEVTHIGQHAFYGCPFRQLYIHDNIRYIGKDAFDNCYYEDFPHGYSMQILVSKGRIEWARKYISSRVSVKEIDII